MRKDFKPNMGKQDLIRVEKKIYKNMYHDVPKPGPNDFHLHKKSSS